MMQNDLEVRRRTNQNIQVCKNRRNQKEEHHRKYRNGHDLWSRMSLPCMSFWRWQESRRPGARPLTLAAPGAHEQSLWDCESHCVTAAPAFEAGTVRCLFVHSLCRVFCPVNIDFLLCLIHHFLFYTQALQLFLIQTHDITHTRGWHPRHTSFSQ